MSTQSERAKRFLIPIVIIMLGTMWLLNVLGVVADVDWVLSGGLAGAGVLILTFGGMDKVTMAAGPWLLVASVTSLLRATGRLEFSHEIPILTVVLGALLLLVEFLKLPLPMWLREEEKPEGDETDEQ